jgi:hypothetical protein
MSSPDFTSESLANAFFDAPTLERAEMVARILESSSHPGFARCVSTLKRMLTSGVQNRRDLARRALEMVDTSPSELRRLQDALRN